MPIFRELASAQRNQSSVFICDRAPGLLRRYFSGIYELTLTNEAFEFSELPQRNTLDFVNPDALLHDKSSNSLFLFGHPYQPNSLSNISDIDSVYLIVYRYDLSTNEWTRAPIPSGNITSTTAWPPNRSYYSITYDSVNNQGYLSGGIGSDRRPYRDFWRIDFVDGNITFTRLIDLPNTRVSHQMAFLSDGRILIIGGGLVLNEYFFTLKQIDVYDTRGAKWIDVGPVLTHNASLPNSLSGHNLVVGNTRSEDSIYSTSDPRISFLLLDLTTWTWDFANTSGKLPEKRDNALAHIMGPDNLIFAFGKDYVNEFNDINVMNLHTMHWVETFNEESQERSRARTRTIIIVVFSAVLGISVLCAGYFCWKEKDTIKEKLGNSSGLVWNRREGEPLWTEFSRLFVIGITIASFVILVVFVVKQVLSSPIIVQSYTLPAEELGIPDFRLCIDNVLEQGLDDILYCSSASGFACGGGFYPLSLSLFRPLAFHKNASCYLFRGSENYTLSPEPLNYLGSSIEVLIKIDEMSANTTPPMPTAYVSVYPREKDPNVLVYNLPDEDQITIDDREYDDWITAEQRGTTVGNLYEIKFFTLNNLEYSSGYRDSLNPTAWNLFGIFSERTRAPLLETTFSSLPPDMEHVEQMAPGMFTTRLRIFPHKFEIEVEEEVKVYTFLGAFGTIGGIAGVLFSIEVLLFGQRPPSPWGLIQRFSFGRMRLSLLRSLRSEFQTTNVPLTDPLGADRSEPGRIERMEQRMWTLERVLAAYHINEDVFKGLSDAGMDERISNGDDNDHKDKQIIEDSSSALLRHHSTNTASLHSRRTHAYHDGIM
ncbi:hypothetical protein BX666DRAFT_2027122 [Dichotomocladium elegans]|nr:hypothetical protein BX666DRAFT_2027122 [Dichotomocladium elegans]